MYLKKMSLCLAIAACLMSKSGQGVFALGDESGIHCITKSSKSSIVLSKEVMDVSPYFASMSSLDSTSTGGTDGNGTEDNPILINCSFESLQFLEQCVKTLHNEELTHPDVIRGIARVIQAMEENKLPTVFREITYFIPSIKSVIADVMVRRIDQIKKGDLFKVKKEIDLINALFNDKREESAKKWIPILQSTMYKHFSDSGYLLYGSTSKVYSCEYDNERVGCIAYTPAGESIVFVERLSDSSMSSCKGRAEVVLWDLKTRSPLKKWSGVSMNSVVVSPCGKYVAFPCKESVMIANVDRRKATTLRGRQREVTSLCFSSSGEFVASGSTDGTVQIWDCVTNLRYQTIKVPSCQEIMDICFTPDESEIAIACKNGTVQFWDFRALQCNKVFSGKQEAINKIIISADGRKLASSSNNFVIVYDLENESSILSIPTQNANASDVFFMPDGNGLCYISNLKVGNKSEGKVVLYNLSTHKRTFLQHDSKINSISINSKDRTIAFSMDGHKDDDPVKSYTSRLLVAKMYSDQERELRTQIDRLSDMEYVPERHVLKDEEETKSCITFSCNIQ